MLEQTLNAVLTDLCVCVLYLEYPEPVYDIEKKPSPRQIKKKLVHAIRQAKYTNL